jgi:hypothetical protein
MRQSAANLRAVHIGHGCLILIAIEKQCFQRSLSEPPGGKFLAEDEKAIPKHLASSKKIPVFL